MTLPAKSTTAVYIVVTNESVEGRYRVEASSPEEAKAKFELQDRMIDWRGVTQIDYMAYSVEVTTVEQRP